MLAEQKTTAFLSDIYSFLEQNGYGSGNSVGIVQLDVAERVHHVVESSILKSVEVAPGPEVLHAHLKVTEKRNTCSDADTVLETVLYIIPGLLAVGGSCDGA